MNPVSVKEDDGVRKRKGIWISVCVVAATCIAVALMGRISLRKQEIKTVETILLKPETITNSVICAGRLEYGEQYAISVDQPIRVDALSVDQGDFVRAGDTLLRLETVSAGEITGGKSMDSGIISAFSGLLGTSDEGNETAYTEKLTAKGVQELKSPYEGLVTELCVGESDVAAACTELVTIARPQSIRMKAALPEEYVQDVSEGMPVSVTGDAFRERTYEGTISRIMPCAYQNSTLTGSGDTVVDVIIEIDAPDEALRAGYTAKAQITCSCREDALLVPYEAVHQDENVEFIYILENGCVSRRDIETGCELTDQVEILSGALPGELLILDADVEEGEAAAIGERDGQ